MMDTEKSQKKLRKIRTLALLFLVVLSLSSCGTYTREEYLCATKYNLIVSADTVIPMVVNTQFMTAAGYYPGYICSGTKIWITNGVDKWCSANVIYNGTIPVEVTGFGYVLSRRYKVSMWDGHFIEELPINEEYNR